MRRSKRSYRPWTADDDQVMRDMHAAEFTHMEIAVALGRNSGTISSKLAKAGLWSDADVEARKRAQKQAAQRKVRADLAAIRALAPKPSDRLMPKKKAHQEFIPEVRPGAVKGPDILLERLQAGRR